MSRPKAICVDRTLISDFNSLRQENTLKSFSFAELKEKFLEIGISLNSPLLINLIRQGCIIKISRGQYAFVDEPVHISLLRKAIDGYYKLKEHYRFSGEEGRKQIAIENAIHLLKENGYIILDKRYML
jgi:hypothetical protein